MSAVSATVAPAPRRLGRANVLLLATAVTLTAVGLVMILSASSVEAYQRYGSSFMFFNRQVIGAAAGLVAMIVASSVDYRRIRKFVAPMLLVSVGLLVAVLIPGVGQTRGGSSRWLVAGPFTFQPSELVKLALVIYVAHLLDRKGSKIADFKEMAVPLLPVTALVCLLIIAQPDLGTMIVCAGIVFAMLFLAGARWKHIAALAAVGLLSVAALAFSEGYRRERVFSFLDPWADPLDTGYQNIQGQIALGSGGWLGVGLGESRQKWSYIPNAHTDFIFAIVGEELGLVGTMSILLLFLFLLYLGARIARKAPDKLGFLIGGGVTAWIGMQALINMSAVAGLVPITGVPLPLISFGGSSLVFTMTGIGILLSIARRARK